MRACCSLAVLRGREKSTAVCVTRKGHGRRLSAPISLYPRECSLQSSGCWSGARGDAPVFAYVRGSGTLAVALPERGAASSPPHAARACETRGDGWPRVSRGDSSRPKAVHATARVSHGAYLIRSEQLLVPWRRLIRPSVASRPLRQPSVSQMLRPEAHTPWPIGRATLSQARGLQNGFLSKGQSNDYVRAQGSSVASV